MASSPCPIGSSTPCATTCLNRYIRPLLTTVSSVISQLYARGEKRPVQCCPKRLEAWPSPKAEYFRSLIAHTAGAASTGGHFPAILLYKRSESAYFPSGFPFWILGVNVYTQRYIHSQNWGPLFSYSSYNETYTLKNRSDRRCALQVLSHFSKMA